MTKKKIGLEVPINRLNKEVIGMGLEIGYWKDCKFAERRIKELTRLGEELLQYQKAIKILEESR